MRLIAQALESAGIATVVVGTMRGMLAGLPRVLITRYDRGCNFGAPGNGPEHAAIAREALDLFDADEPALREHRQEVSAAPPQPG